MRWARRATGLLGARAPRLEGALTIDGIAATVTIRRDRHGVPHIDAADDRDAWFGLGFAIGQDRTFQLDFYRRAVSGTMAAAVGPSALAHDRFVRRIGYHRTASLQRDELDRETLQLLDAYAEGINAGQSVGRRRRSLEHALLFLDPAPWSAVDVLAFIKVITASLSTNWDAELARSRILERDGAAALEAVDAPYPASSPVTFPVGECSAAIDDLAADIAQHQRWLPIAGGSNNWAVDGTRTASGRAIVANDPHLNPQVPSQWYLAHVRTPEWEAAGATLVGAPGFIAGHNGHVAWGVTAGRADLSDLVIETLAPDRSAVLRSGGWVPCTMRTEVIEVRGRAPVVETVTITDSGPIVSPMLDDERSVFSLRATWLDPGPLRGFFDAGRQRTVAGLVETFREWSGPSVNLIAADECGIGWKYVAAAPARRSKPSRLPVHGHDPDHAWPTARVAFDALPGAHGSGNGVLATANNQPLPDGKGPDLGSEWSDGYRVRRIVSLLCEQSDWDADGIARVQLDQRLGLWEEIGSALRDGARSCPDAAIARRLLDGWDGVASADSVAASIFELTTQELTRRLMRRWAPASTDLAMGAPVHAMTPFSGLAVRRASWLAAQVVRQGATRDLAIEIEAALSESVRMLRREMGDRQSRWQWGRVRPLRIRHLLSDVPILGSALSLGPIRTGGSLHTVSMCASSPLDPLANPVAIATLRMVVEIGDWDGARFVLAGGQSGDPTSPHYDDQLAHWARGSAIAIPWSPSAVEAAAQHELRLEPASPMPLAEPAIDDPTHRADARRRRRSPAEPRR